MDMPISRAAAYLKRNRSTHSWAGESDLMSRSCPNSHTLHDHMLQARAAAGGRLSSEPRYNRRSINVTYRSGSTPPSSSSSSPGRPASSSLGERGGTRGSKPDERPPSSSYSYDGGFFISANNAAKDFFVIDPEWVSEDKTVKRLATGDAVDGATRQAGGKGSDSWRRSFKWSSYRRSKSAPPAKHRNPITWKE